MQVLASDFQTIHLVQVQAYCQTILLSLAQLLVFQTILQSLAQARLPQTQTL